jgi:hypothetical protein
MQEPRFKWQKPRLWNILWDQNEISRRRRRRRRRWYTHVVITFKITKHKMDCPLLVFSQELHTQVNSTLCGYCEAMGRFFHEGEKRRKKRNT